MVDQNFEGEVYYLEFEDENGNKQYFTEDVILNHEGQEYAVLLTDWKFPQYIVSFILI